MSVSVVLLHAMSTTSEMWRDQSAALRSAGHLVVAPDLRGHGRMPLGTAAPSLDVVADDLASTLDQRGIDTTVLVGTSMGAYVALAFVRRHPGRISGLALLGTRATADDSATVTARLAFADQVCDPALRPELLAAAVPRLVGATSRDSRPDVVARVSEMVNGVSAEGVAWAQRAIAVRADSLDLLSSITVPSTVVAGTEDELVAVDEAELMASVLPHGRLVLVPGAGHLAPIEAPAAVTAAITELIARVAGQVRQ